MAREAREVSSTGMYAVTVRTKENVFENDEVKELFSSCTARFLGEGVRAVKYGPDRVQMLIYETDKGISADMKSIMTSFSRSCNKVTGRAGKVFADRFASVPVESGEAEASCMSYLSGEGETPEAFAAGQSKQQEESAQKKPSAKARTKGTQKEKPAAKAKTTERKAAETLPEKTEEKTVPKKKIGGDDLPIWLL